MKKFTLLLFILLVVPFILRSQPGYDLKINLKSCNDTVIYLVKYLFDQQYMADTCKKVRSGNIEFKGATSLDKGMYALVGQGMVKYLDVFVNESERFSVSGDLADLSNTLKTSSRENELMFSYTRFMNAREQEYRKLVQQSRGKSKADSLLFMRAHHKAINDEVKKFSDAFMEKNKGSFVCDFLNLRTDKYLKEVPKASNGRPDSVAQYYYYKSHYLDGINFKDERIDRVPFFADRIKKYMSDVVVQQPDTIIKELDKIFAKCDQGNIVYNSLLGYFTYKYEQNKLMSFDKFGKTTTFEKVFVHLADQYIVNGKAKGVYTDEVAAKIKERVDIVRNLLPEAKVSELFMIDTTYGSKVLKMGFDTASSAKSVTELYYKNAEKLTPLFKTLYQVDAKYTVLVFWAVDCDHCKKEIPKLNNYIKNLKGKVDVKVFAVQTKEDLFDDWKRFIIENKLDFINVFDPVHINNTKERFDINSTPVIYLLDRDKKIKGKKLAAEQVPEIIKNLESIENP